MLLSMTGFGEAHGQHDESAVRIEVRSVNSRFFKVAVRTGDGYGALEPLVESVVRSHLRRGTVQVNVRIDRGRAPDDCKINAEILDSYRRQLEALHRQWDMAGRVSLESLLLLPGVVNENAGPASDASADWPLVRRALDEALQNLMGMRAEEGRAMADDLKANCRAAATSLEQIEHRAPRVVNDYRSRLEERLKRILAEHEIELDPADLIKEVSLFAERGDISEEIVRLRSHLDQFEATMELPESSGRKLDFLTQEMFREANTIGSKANDVEIARAVIEIKAAVERIREMIQNVE